MKCSTPFALFMLVTAIGLSSIWPGQADAQGLGELDGPLVLSLDASAGLDGGGIPRTNANGDPLLALDGSNVTLWGQEYGFKAWVPFTLDPEGLPSEAPFYNPTGLNGMPTIDFAKSDSDFLLANVDRLLRGDGDEYSIFFVADAMDGSGTTFSQQAYSSGGSLSFRNGANWSMRIGGSAGGPGVNGFFDSGNPTSNGFEVRSVIGDPTSVTWDIGGTANVIADTDHAIRALGVFTLGNRFSPFNHPANMSLAELVVFDTALDQDTRTGVNSVLATKWGLTPIPATPEQIAMGTSALTQPPSLPPPPPIAHYHFTNGTTSGTIDSVDSSDEEANSIAGEWSTGGAEFISTCCGNPDRGAFFGGKSAGVAGEKGWVSIGEIGPGVPSTVSSFAPPVDQTPTVDEDYIGFTVLPNEGFQMDLEKVTFDIQRDSIDGRDSWGLYADEDSGSDGDNFATKLGGETGAEVPTGGVRDYTNFEIDISGFGFLQDVTEATSFRLYFWHDGEFSNDVWLADEQAGTGGTELSRTSSRLDNVILVGMVEELGIGPDPIAGDYNNSGEVEVGDLNLVLFNWDSDTVPAEWVNQIPTGTVGVDQLNGVLFNWGNTSTVATVPEPGCIWLAGLSLLAWIRQRRV